MIMNLKPGCTSQSCQEKAAPNPATHHLVLVDNHLVGQPCAVAVATLCGDCAGHFPKGDSWPVYAPVEEPIRPYVCHLQDVRRPVSRTSTGRPRQVPVICKLDLIQVIRGGRDTWSKFTQWVTCPDCAGIIQEGAEASAAAGVVL